MLRYDNNQAPVRVLVCQIGRDRFGLSFDWVAEVVQAVALTPLPGAPPIVEGVINVRGTPVPVIELRTRIGLARERIKPSDHLVLARASRQLVAIRVDRVVEVLDIASDHFKAADQLRGASSWVAGAAVLPDGLVIVCDLEAFLQEAERLALEHAMSNPADRPSS